MSFMFAVCILFLCVSNVIVAMSNLTKPFVMVNMAFFALQIGSFIPKSSGEAAADYGFDTKARDLVPAEKGARGPRLLHAPSFASEARLTTSTLHHARPRVITHR